MLHRIAVRPGESPRFVCGGCNSIFEGADSMCEDCRVPRPVLAGDRVARFIRRSTGIAPCSGCESRKQILNRVDRTIRSWAKR